MTVVTVTVFWGPADPPAALLAAPERHAARELPGYRRRHWTAGRLAARAALRLLTGPLPDSLAILPAETGAPVVHGLGEGRRVGLSISHCDGWSAAACAEADSHWPDAAAVGVDIELAQACDPATLARAAGWPRVRSSAEATRCWSRLEAAYKACAGDPPLLRDYRLTGARQVSATPRERPERRLRTWTETLPGAVVTTASVTDAVPRLHSIDASALAQVIAS